MTAAPPGPRPAADEGSLAAVNEGGIVDAADFVGGGVAPGEIVSIFGTNLGPAEGVQPGFDQTGKLPTSVADVTVFFNDIPAPLFFLSLGPNKRPSAF